MLAIIGHSCKWSSNHLGLLGCGRTMNDCSKVIKKHYGDTKFDQVDWKDIEENMELQMCSEGTICATFIESGEKDHPIVYCLVSL